AGPRLHDPSVVLCGSQRRRLRRSGFGSCFPGEDFREFFTLPRCELRRIVAEGAYRRFRIGAFAVGWLDHITPFLRVADLTATTNVHVSEAGEDRENSAISMRPTPDGPGIPIRPTPDGRRVKHLIV